VATTLARFTQLACSALWAVRAKPCAAADAVSAESNRCRIAPLFHCERLGLGAGWCNTPSPVLRGAGNEPSHGRDIVAPPGNQAATENTNFCLHDGENPAYSPAQLSRSLAPSSDGERPGDRLGKARAPVADDCPGPSAMASRR
jgi:hypothetical protein